MKRHIFPDMEGAVVDSAITHFLLMLGYRLFSVYFSLFLIDRGLALAKVGYTYFLIYLSIVICAPIVGMLLYRLNPIILSSVGILGYGAYSLGMIYSQGALFDVLQILLGASASLFFVASRSLFIRLKLKNYNSAFGIFHSAPTYANFFAPVMGGLLIWRFGFNGVLVASFIIHLINVFFNIHTLSESGQHEKREINLRKIGRNYWTIFSSFNRLKLTPYIMLSFCVLVVAGLYNAYFLLFLRNIGLSQNDVITYISLFSFVFIFISINRIKILGRIKSSDGFARGGFLYGLASILLGLLGSKIGVVGIFAVDILKTSSAFIVGAMRSGLIAMDFTDYSEEAGVIDTIFAPLGTAIGAFIGGILVDSIGYGSTFKIAGLFIITITIIYLFLKKYMAAGNPDTTLAQPPLH
ncbi:MAG: hypothetical protein A2846_01860 [Candidatus Doudnabacteria bacterium RIFCSPHIGHO2_01_FULL_49_9]|nr:MAG: hypothetical protein A2846_01860 [Candidatus Doudnabacteria bacterium RIFCSPHIGHO2_01_FULL_49_9]